MEKFLFPEGFLWGTASSSYQVEGAVREDGRGESIWDRYCSIPGNVAGGDTGDIACDHYHRYKEDVALMKEMGMTAYRFSVAWPRVIPDGRGAINEKGLEFYENLVDELLKAGIAPMLTLYHWDLPQALQDIGGWANPDMPEYFLRFSRIMMERLGGRVRRWITLNEPYCAAFLGNYVGRQAPGIKDFSTALRVAYYQYVAHGLVVRHFRESGMEGEIGIALNLMGRLPFSDKPEDIEAARRADGYLNRWFLDPIIRGEYPGDMLQLYREKGVVLPEFKPEHRNLMCQPLDFIGLNYYNDFTVVNDDAAWPVHFAIKNPRYAPVNSRGWPITEDGFANMLLRMKNEYGIGRILITENGTSTIEVESAEGRAEDPQRVDYLKRHLAALHRAMAQGVEVFGYMQWSFCDNFEWAFGYDSRFGLVYVDFESQKRIIKQSGRWYAAVAKENGFTF